MKLSEFDYKYPEELVAQRPLEKRDASRMMVVNRESKNLEHSFVSNLPDFLNAGDLIVFNDSKVIPARIFGTRGRGEPIEVLVVEPVTLNAQRSTLNGCYWRCLLKKAKRIRDNDKFFFGMHATARVVGREDIFLVLEFKDDALKLAIKHHGVPPLPPYINREGKESYTEEDRERYQTIFAKNSGSAAAPTAGLHFSKELIQKITDKGVSISHVTLHIGIDTFTPMRKETTSGHKMHGERFEVSGETAGNIIKTKKNGGRIVVVGTTTLRALESAHNEETGSVTAKMETTRLFITPGYKFNVTDVLLTNFHQPKSTLLILVSAFAGREFIFDCYNEAFKEKYRLFSYGDCMLIL